jgi:uncharacterized membrane protein
MTRGYLYFCLALVAAAFVASAVLYPRLPEQIPIHWNIHGEIDGYGSKHWALFLTPGLMLGLLGLFLALPWLSPKQFSLDSFRSTYGFIIAVIMATTAYIHGLTLWAAAAGQVDITRALLAGLLIMFGLMGNVMGKVRRNFYVGVRTPWTLASDRVWNDTHRLAGQMFVAGAAVGLVCVLLPIPVAAVTITTIVVIVAAALTPAVYSLVHYKRLERRGELDVAAKNEPTN